MHFNWRIPVMALSLWLLSMPASAEDRMVGNSSVKWEDGQSCREGVACFEIHQFGASGVSLSHGCPYRPILATTISGVPDTIHKYVVLSMSGIWQIGIDKVELKPGTIVVRTYVIQNHGHVYCLSPGQGDFKLAFY